MIKPKFTGGKSAITNLNITVYFDACGKFTTISF